MMQPFSFKKYADNSAKQTILSLVKETMSKGLETFLSEIMTPSEDQTILYLSKILMAQSTVHFLSKSGKSFLTKDSPSRPTPALPFFISIKNKIESMKDTWQKTGAFIMDQT